MAAAVVIRSLQTADFAGAAALDEDNLSAWNSKLIAEHVEQPGSWCFAAWHNCHKLIVGYILGKNVADEAEVYRLAVAKEYQRQRIGSRLLSHALAAMKRNGVRNCFLEVRQSNMAARILYERAGFAVSGQRKAYYQNPQEDAVLMTRNM